RRVGADDANAAHTKSIGTPGVASEQVKRCGDFVRPGRQVQHLWFPDAPQIIQGSLNRERVVDHAVADGSVLALDVAPRRKRRQGFLFDHLDAEPFSGRDSGGDSWAS